MASTAITIPKYPKEGTTCRIIWDAADKLASTGAEVKRGDLITALPDLAKGTVTTQLQRWRQHHGIAKFRGKNSVPGGGPKKGAANAGRPSKKAAKKAAPKKKAARKATAKKAPARRRKAKTEAAAAA